MNSRESMKLFLRNFAITALYYLAVFTLLQVYRFLFYGNTWLYTHDAFLNWDAQHYYFISQHGYEGFHLAFFPLLPILWKLTGQGVYPVVFINAIIFLISFALLSVFIRVKKTLELLLLASVPCLMFMFVPYTEALFFAFGTLLLVGLRKNIPVLICAGMLLCGLTRPSATVFIPAILLTVSISNDGWKKKIQKGVLYSLFALAGLGITLLIQHSYTGHWFDFFEAQKGWGNQLRIPKFPLTTWAGGKIVRLDATALLVGMFSLGYIIRILKLRKYKTGNISDDFFFALCCLAGIALLILFYRGGSLFSLSRFIFATPFFTLVLYSFCKNYRFTYNEVGLFLLLSTIYWLSFASYVHIQYFLKFVLLSIYIAFYFLLNNKQDFVKSTAWYGLIIINSALLMYFYFRFLIFDWVG